MLGGGVVDGDDRVGKHAVAGHGPQADDAGGRLFGAGDDAGQQVGPLFVDDSDRVGAVVHRHLGAVVERLVDVAVVGGVVFALDGKDRHAILDHQRSGDVVLGAERIAGAQPRVGPAGLEGAHQVGRLGGDVQAGGDADAGQRLFAVEPLADQPQDGHLLLGPLDFALAGVGQAQVFDIMF